MDLINKVAPWSGAPGARPGRAPVQVRHGQGAGVRRWAEEITPGPDGDRMTLRYADPEWFASWLVGFGSDVVVLGPPEVRDAAVARLREIAEAHRVPAGGPSTGGAAPAAPPPPPAGCCRPPPPPPGR